MNVSFEKTSSWRRPLASTSFTKVRVITEISRGATANQTIRVRRRITESVSGLALAFVVRSAKMRMPRFLVSAAAAAAVTTWIGEIGSTEGIRLPWIVLGGASALMGRLSRPVCQAPPDGQG